MTVFAEITVPPATIALGRLVPDDGAVRVELARAVPTGEFVRCLWIVGDDRDAVLARLDEDLDASATEIDTLPDRTLVRLDEAPDDAVTDLVAAVDGVVLDASCDGSRWTIRLRFPDRDAVSAFRDGCSRRDIDVRIRQLNASPRTDPAADVGPSPDQREAILLAFREGYFEVPREASLTELADALGVSGQALSERLRRGSAALLESTVMESRSDSS